jgi:hypothetical protein
LPSLVTSISPGPSVPGLEKGTQVENRFFVLGLPDGRRVMSNGDGSLVFVLAPRKLP